MVDHFSSKNKELLTKLSKNLNSKIEQGYYGVNNLPELQKDLNT